MSLSIELQDRAYTRVLPPERLRLTVSGYGWAVQGGPRWAEIELSGETGALLEARNWLRHTVIIRNQNNDPVWWGYVDRVEVPLGALTLAADLAEMRNYIKVGYTNADGVASYTAWAEDTYSTGEYGYREEILSSTLDAAEAATLRDTALEVAKYPAVAPLSGSPSETGRLYCRGWWDTLEWRYYSRADGLVEHTEGGARYKIGQTLTAATIGFDQDNRRILDTGGSLRHIDAGQRVDVTGSTYNNSNFMVESATALTAKTLTAATISFTAATKRVADSGNGLKFVDANDIVRITGSASNNGYYSVSAGAGDGSYFDTDQALVNEAAGASVTVTRASGITVEGGLRDEIPAATVTVQPYGASGIAQSFVQSSGSSWAVDRVQVQVGKFGSPSDNIRAAIWSNSAGAPSASLDSGTVAGSSVNLKSGWVEITLTKAATLTSGTTYWLVIDRSSTLDIDDYYTVGIDQEAGYSAGSVLVKDAAGAWQSPPKPLSLTFRVLGSTETTEQLSALRTGAGQFLSGTDIVDASGRYMCQYRDGTLRGSEVADKLLALGTTANRWLLATVTVDRYLQLDAEDAPPTTPEYYIDKDGNIVGNFGQSLAEGQCPVGVWASLLEVGTLSSALEALAPIFVVTCDYDPESGKRTFEARGQKTIADLLGG